MLVHRRLRLKHIGSLSITKKPHHRLQAVLSSSIWESDNQTPSAFGNPIRFTNKNTCFSPLKLCHDFCAFWRTGVHPFIGPALMRLSRLGLFERQTHSASSCRATNAGGLRTRGTFWPQSTPRAKGATRKSLLHSVTRVVTSYRTEACSSIHCKTSSSFQKAFRQAPFPPM